MQTGRLTLPGLRKETRPVLQDGLTAIGLDISRDKLETEVNWLKEQGLVEMINKLTKDSILGEEVFDEIFSQEDEIYKARLR